LRFSDSLIHEKLQSEEDIDSDGGFKERQVVRQDKFYSLEHLSVSPLRHC